MTLRLAVVGCGAIARRAHLPALESAGADVVVFASRSLASAEAAAAEWGSGEVTDDWRSVVGRGDLDGIVVCTPNHLHAEIAVAAAGAGKHVLVEKPMARTVDEADRMIEAATAADVLLMPAHNLRFVAPFVAIRGAVAAGRVGSVTSVRAALGHGGPEGWAPAATWFRDADAAGGGALLDLGVHLADLVRAVLGDDVVEVTAMLRGGTPGVEDSGVALLRFAGGATGSIHASWEARPGPDHQLTVFGTEGTLHVDGRTPATLFPGDGGDAVRLDVADPAPDDPYRAFVRAIETGATPPVTAADGRAALAVIRAAYEAAATGKAVAVT
jgi:predicted dehydrogenase